MKTVSTLIMLSMIVVVAAQTHIDRGARLMVAAVVVVAWMAIITHRSIPRF